MKQDIIDDAINAGMYIPSDPDCEVFTIARDELQQFAELTKARMQVKSEPKWWAINLTNVEPETQLFSKKETALQWQKDYLADGIQSTIEPLYTEAPLNKPVVDELIERMNVCGLLDEVKNIGVKIAMDKTLIDEMVNRFLGWKLPSDFSPDCGIKFDKHPMSPIFNYEPTGTNLFNSEQARQMFAYVLKDLTSQLTTNTETVPLEKYNRAIEALICIDEDLVNPVYYRLVKEAIAEAEGKV